MLVVSLALTYISILAVLIVEVREKCERPVSLKMRERPPAGQE